MDRRTEKPVATAPSSRPLLGARFTLADLESDPAFMSSDLRGVVAGIKAAEEAVATARADFLRLRNTVDSAGELALVEHLEAAERALADAVRQLNEMVEWGGQSETPG